MMAHGERILKTFDLLISYISSDQFFQLWFIANQQQNHHIFIILSCVLVDC